MPSIIRILMGRIRKKGVTGNDRVHCLSGRVSSASLTVECAGVITIFFIACLSLISFMDAVRIQAEKNLSLSNEARKIACVASIGGETIDGIWIDLIRSYRFEVPFPMFGLKKIKVALRARVYPYIGSEDGIAEEGGDGRNEMVYVTENESVYHTHADCTHINLTIIKTDMAGIANLRNEYGRKYRKCSNFPHDYDGPVYVTATGEYYYPSLEYGSLTRHVCMKKRSECRGLRKCERCEARDRREESFAA